MKAPALAVLGEAHLSSSMATYFQVDPESVRYARVAAEDNGLSFILEVALGVLRDDVDCQGQRHNLPADFSDRTGKQARLWNRPMLRQAPAEGKGSIMMSLHLLLRKMDPPGSAGRTWRRPAPAMRPFDLMVAAGLLFATGARAGARSLHVDPGHAHASDRNPGSAAKPFRTISGAAAVARAGDVVTIAPGTYAEAIVVQHSGTPEQPITFAAAKPGSVVVTGADRLRGWQREPGDAPRYRIAWAHDFIINTLPDGTLVRAHMAPPPVGCAEQVIADGRPLSQVLKPDETQPGTFFVDWDHRRLTVWLTGGRDPDQTPVLGSTRSTLFGPALGSDGNPGAAAARHVTVKGLTFRYAANFAQRPAVSAASGWRVEDCTVEWTNGVGLAADGKGITFLRDTVQRNGEEGMGGTGKNILVQDCTLRWNNTKGFSPADEGGACKFDNSDHVRVIHCRSYENTGPGWWFDWGNSHYEIRDCTIYGNRGLHQDWEGNGIFLEASQGPGQILNNRIYSNTGAGIDVAESQQVTLTGNTLVDDGVGIEFRAMEGRANHKLEDVTVRGNRLKAWRKVAVTTSVGNWSPTSAADKHLQLSDNLYDPFPGNPLYSWAGQSLTALPAVQHALGVEQNSRIGSFAFTLSLVPSRTLTPVPTP